MKLNKTGRTLADVYTKNIEIVVPFRYFSRFQGILKMPLTNGEINPQLIWQGNCIIRNSKGAGTFKITNKRLNVLLVTLATQGSTKLLQQLNSGFKKEINWSKYLILILGNCFRQRKWHNRLLAWLSILWKNLQNDCNRSEQTTGASCWSRNDTAN